MVAILRISPKLDSPFRSPLQPFVAPMKITQIATVGILLLVVAAGYLMMDSANDKKFAAQQDKLNAMMDAINKLNKPTPVAPAESPAAAPAPTPAPAAVTAAPTAAPTVAAAPTPKLGTPPATPNAQVPAAPPLPDPASPLTVAAKEKELLDAQLAQLKEETTPPQYNPLQAKIKNLPAIAKIKTYNTELGFIEIDAGKNRNLEKGMTFHIRRDAMLVGRVKVSDSIEEASSIADVEPKSVPEGCEIHAGDELVKYD